MEKEGLLFVVSGPSGVGKGTLCAKLLNELPEMALSISHTTRKKRPGEQEGKNYFFIDKEAFLANIKNGAYLEWAEVYGNYYGTPQALIEENMVHGIDTLLEIDTQGAILVKERFPEAVFIFVLPPDQKTLAGRLIERKTDSEEVIFRRLAAFGSELEQLPMYDYVVVNGELDSAVRDLFAIFRAEHLRFENTKSYVSLKIGGETIDDD